MSHSLQFLVFTVAGWRLVVQEYVEHCHRERKHQGLDNELLTPLSRPPDPNADVQCRKRIGGLLNYYHRQAA